MALTVIGLEEHFATADLVEAWQRLDPVWQDLALADSAHGEPARRLTDLGDSRLAAMDETGVNIQVLSVTTPGVQNLAPPDAVALQTDINDFLAETVRTRPDRLQGFAALATPSAADAARELERAITVLGLDGAMLFGRTRDRHLDDPAFWPIFEVASAHNAPLYLHPQSPPSSVRAAYYSGLGDSIDTAVATHGLGWHYDVGVELVRLILSGVFDRFPGLQVIAGHWGEMVSFYLDRIDHLGAAAGLARSPAEYFRSNVFLTPSGIFSQRYLRWAIEIVGVERILFATDYPFAFASEGGARRFLEDADLNDADRTSIASGNWDRLRAAIRR